VSELTKIKPRSLIVGLCRIFFGVEIAEEFKFTFDSYITTPLFPDFVPMNSFEPTTTVPCQLLISAILCMATFAEVLTAVIKCIVIFVITFFFGVTSENNSGHVVYHHSLANSDAPRGRKAFSLLAPNSAPIPFRQPTKVLGVHDSVLALREGDESVGLVKRLVNFMSSDLVRSTLGAHRSSSQGLLQFSRYFITGEIYAN
jgi:hypothetical protein